MVMMSYATIKNIIIQRKNHPLKEWLYFIDEMYLQLNHTELLPEEPPAAKPDFLGFI